jgi:hypothetical protein
MAVDTFAKRMTVAGVPFLPLGVNVFPGTTNTVLGRGAAAWNYATAAPTPPVGGDADFSRSGLGQRRSFSAGGNPSLGDGSW